MITLVILSILILAGYTAAVCIKTKGIPYSISATYYAIEHKMAFGWCMTLTAMLLLPAVWDLSPTFLTKSLAVLACTGLLGVGIAPDFRNDWINKVHCASAGVTLISSQLWVGLVGFCWLLVPLWAGFIAYTIISMYRHPADNLYRRFVQTKPMFWVEIVSLESFFTTAIILTV